MKALLFITLLTTTITNSPALKENRLRVKGPAVNEYRQKNGKSLRYF